MLDLIRFRIEKRIIFSRQKLLSRNHSGGLVRVAHSLLLTSTGRVLSFGTGQYGALGHGYSGGKQLPDILRPTYIEGKYIARSHQKSNRKTNNVLTTKTSITEPQLYQGFVVFA